MKFRKLLLSFVTLSAVVFLVVKNEKVTESVMSSLTLCAKSLIPALFPFFVVSGILVSSGALTALGEVLSPISKKIFKVSGNGAVVFVIGLLCGYPMGASVATQLYNENKITKDEGERLVSFCNNSGPLFVIGAVGNMLGSVRAGVFLYTIHALSAAITGVVLSFFARKEQEGEKITFSAMNFGKVISENVEKGVKTMLSVCGYVIFFGILIELLKELVPNAVISGLLEVTTGAKGIISEITDKSTMLILLSGIIGFGGLCVAFQVQSIISEAGFSVRKYIFAKAFQCAVSMLICSVYLFMTEEAFVFARVNPFPKNNILILFLLALFFVCMTPLGLTKKN